MNRNDAATWALLPSAHADPSWLSAQANNFTRRAIRLGSSQLGAAIVTKAACKNSDLFIEWLTLPEAELRRFLGFASLVLFKQAVGALLVSGALREEWVAQIGMQPLIDLLRMADDGQPRMDTELVPDWKCAADMFHPGLALMYALLSRRNSQLSLRLLQRFNKQEVQGIYQYLNAIDANHFSTKEHLLFGFGERCDGYGNKS